MKGDIHVTYILEMEDEDARQCKEEIKKIIALGNIDIPKLAEFKELLSDLLQES